MRESGIIQPVIVFKRDNRYYLIVGERRWRAAQLLKWEKIPAIIRQASENEVMADSLIENIQREGLNAIEISEGLDALIRMTGASQQEVAEKLGMSRTAVTNYLRLLKLPGKIKEYVISGRLDQGHARALLALQSESDMLRLAEVIATKALSVRKAESAVKNFYRKKLATEKKTDPNIIRIETQLTQHFSTKVKLDYNPTGGAGKVEIFFSSLEEFQRILALLTKE